MPENMTLEEALKRIDQLEAANAALKGVGRINREVKNSVFLDMFRRKEYLVQMCRSIHPGEDVAEDDLTVVTLENILAWSHFNDMGVLWSRKGRKLLILAECQSLWSVNVIFRLWEYVIDTLMTYFINNGYDIHGTPKLPMPDVETYIIYTGRSIPRILSSGRLETDPEGRQILSLNKEFFGGEAGKPELTAKVLYVKNSDGIIEEYIRFSQVFDEQRMKFKDETEKVYPEVFRICEEEGILTEYLSKHKAEVEKIMMTMVSPEYVQKASQRTARIQEAIEMGRAAGQTDDFIRDYLMNKFGITYEYAQNCLDTEWVEDTIFA